MTTPSASVARRSDSLADLLERVLDKGVVIVGDIVVSVLDVELLSLKLRLFIASVDTARELGMDWWSSDPFYSSQGRHEMEARDAQRRLQEENDELRRRVAALEQAAAQAGIGSPAQRAVPIERVAPARQSTRGDGRGADR